MWIGGLSVLGNDGQVQPAFVQKSARHKNLNSTMRYIRPSLKSSLAMSDILCGNDPDKGWTERFTGRRHTQIPFLNSTQVRDSANSANQWDISPALPSKGIAFARKTPPGPPTHSQPPKRKANEVHWSFSAKRRTTSGTQTHPTLVEEVEAPSEVTPLRSETQTQRMEYFPESSQGAFPPSLGILRSRLSGVSITFIPAPPEPVELTIPSVEEEEIPATTSPQE